MLFSSIVFLFLFLPIVLLLYHLAFFPVSRGWHPAVWRKVSNAVLLSSSLLFYFWGEKWRIWILLVTLLVGYLAGRLMSRGLAGHPLQPGGARTRAQTMTLGVAVTALLALLMVFKYLYFGVTTTNQLLGALHLSSLKIRDFEPIALPLGISFFTFQAISYAVDVYRGRVKASQSLLDFACYKTLFPQLIAGPIVRYADVASDLVSRRSSSAQFASGVTRFVGGLSKKVLIANTVSAVADRIFDLPPSDLSFGLAWLGALAYTLHIYFDFSGYSDMAIGMGRMLGFEFLENFNYPYVSRSITEFWRRWHISLSSWFRDYVYIPLGGNRISPSRTLLNLLVVFFLCGLWHGAQWTFVVWGLYHGVFLVLERTVLERVLQRLPRILSHVYAMLVVTVGWVLFRAESFSQAWTCLRAMAGMAGPVQGPESLATCLTPDAIIGLALGVVLSMPLYPLVQRRIRAFTHHPRFGRVFEVGFQTARLMSVIGLLVLCAMGLASETHNPFIYFRF